MDRGVVSNNVVEVLKKNLNKIRPTEKADDIFENILNEVIANDNKQQIVTRIDMACKKLIREEMKRLTKSIENTTNIIA